MLSHGEKNINDVDSYTWTVMQFSFSKQSVGHKTLCFVIWEALCQPVLPEVAWKLMAVISAILLSWLSQTIWDLPFFFFLSFLNPLIAFAMARHNAKCLTFVITFAFTQQSNAVGAVYHPHFTDEETGSPTACELTQGHPVARLFWSWTGALQSPSP